jgi:hypothetical protein
MNPKSAEFISPDDDLSADEFVGQSKGLPDRLPGGLSGMFLRQLVMTNLHRDSY